MFVQGHQRGPEGGVAFDGELLTSTVFDSETLSSQKLVEDGMRVYRDGYS
jgi:hypothetical protein